MGHTVVLTNAVNRIHLVLHQSYKRRYYNGSAVHKERRQLIAQAFTATRRHQHESIFLVEQIADNGLLVAFKRIIAKIML